MSQVKRGGSAESTSSATDTSPFLDPYQPATVNYPERAYEACYQSDVAYGALPQIDNPELVKQLCDGNTEMLRVYYQEKIKLANQPNAWPGIDVEQTVEALNEQKQAIIDSDSRYLESDSDSSDSDNGEYGDSESSGDGEGSDVEPNRPFNDSGESRNN